MPVTAKLSRRFYEKLGDDVANELVDWFNSVDATYRADLREINEHNLARFESRLDQRLAELRGEFVERFALLERSLLRWLFSVWATLMLAIVGLAVTVLLRT